MAYLSLEEKNPQNNFLKYSNLGMQLLFAIGFCSWLGLKIDQNLELKFPAFLLMFMLLSFAGMLYKIYRSLNE
jgi:hypothetical protein